VNHVVACRQLCETETLNRTFVDWQWMFSHRTTTETTRLGDLNQISGSWVQSWPRWSVNGMTHTKINVLLFCDIYKRLATGVFYLYSISSLIGWLAYLVERRTSVSQMRGSTPAARSLPCKNLGHVSHTHVQYIILGLHAVYLGWLSLPPSVGR